MSDSESSVVSLSEALLLIEFSRNFCLRLHEALSQMFEEARLSLAISLNDWWTDGDAAVIDSIVLSY